MSHLADAAHHSMFENAAATLPEAGSLDLSKVQITITQFPQISNKFNRTIYHNTVKNWLNLKCPQTSDRLRLFWFLQNFSYLNTAHENSRLLLMRELGISLAFSGREEAITQQQKNKTYFTFRNNTMNQEFNDLQQPHVPASASTERLVWTQHSEPNSDTTFYWLAYAWLNNKRLTLNVTREHSQGILQECYFILDGCKVLLNSHNVDMVLLREIPHRDSAQHLARLCTQDATLGLLGPLQISPKDWQDLVYTIKDRKPYVLFIGPELHHSNYFKSKSPFLFSRDCVLHTTSCDLAITSLHLVWDSSAEHVVWILRQSADHLKDLTLICQKGASTQQVEQEAILTILCSGQLANLQNLAIAFAISSWDLTFISHISNRQDVLNLPSLITLKAEPCLVAHFLKHRFKFSDGFFVKTFVLYTRFSSRKQTKQSQQNALQELSLLLNLIPATFPVLVAVDNAILEDGHVPEIPHHFRLTPYAGQAASANHAMLEELRNGLYRNEDIETVRMVSGSK